MNDNLIFKYGKDINWSIPVLFQYEAVWGCIYHLFKDYGVNLPQVNAFGAPAINWGGGRAPMLRDEINSKMMLRIYNYLNSANAVPALTFTYTELTKDDLKDRYANYFLDIALEAKAHFIICSDLLKNYIKDVLYYIISVKNKYIKNLMISIFDAIDKRGLVLKS